MLIMGSVIIRSIGRRRKKTNARTHTHTHTHTRARTHTHKGEANTKRTDCNEGKFENCSYKILAFTFGKLS
jgi:hypothetical protein